MDANLDEVDAAIDRLVLTTALSRDQATAIAMHFPEPGFLTYLAEYGSANLWAVHSLYLAYRDNSPLKAHAGTTRTLG